MKTINVLELSNIVGGQVAAQNAVGYGMCMNKAGGDFSSANQGTINAFQNKQLSPDQFVSQGVSNATAYQSAAGACASQFPLK
ncbi:MAG TPA: hypothetical protein VGG74_10130 [Kofleriaceae bacterium]|jgi:hypothetical protein